jgi:hypothetical protein
LFFASCFAVGIAADAMTSRPTKLPFITGTAAGFSLVEVSDEVSAPFASVFYDKAIISTPYWHAAELLEDGRGALVSARANLAAGVASNRSNCKGPIGLPCAVTPLKTRPPV